MAQRTIGAVRTLSVADFTAAMRVLSFRFKKFVCNFTHDNSCA